MSVLQDMIMSLKFLTIIPLPDPKNINWRNVIAFFPLSGFFLGLILYACSVFPVFFPYMALCLWVLVTGGFHLDGLSDSFDALAVGKDKNERLNIMKDSRIGNFGAIAVTLLLIIKFHLIVALYRIFIILPPVWGRVILVFVPFIFNPAKEEGLGFFVKKNIGRREFILALFFAFVVTILVSGSLLLAFICCFLTFAFGLFWGTLWTRKVGGFTGDILGAACEICEVLILALLLVWRG